MKLFFSSVQWALFILMSSVIVPITLSELYDFSFEESIDFVQRTLFVLGLAGLLHVLFGHKLPIQEGPTNLWWAIFIFFASTGTTLFSNYTETLNVLQSGLLISGVVFLIFSLTKGLRLIEKLMTPTILAVYLILLVVQLSGTFIKGLMGITETSNSIDLLILLLSIILIALNYYISTFKYIKQYSVLITIIVGWTVFFVLGLTTPMQSVDTIFNIPTITSLTKIDLYPSIIPLIIGVTLLLMMNMIVTIQVVQKVYDNHNQMYLQCSQRNAGIVSGINQILAGLFSTVGPVPISGTASFIESTKQFLRLPFIIGSLLVVIVSFFPVFISFIVTIPPPVGYAAIFPVFSIMLVLAMDLLYAVAARARMYKILSISLFTGIGIMFVQIDSFINISPTIVPLASNGLVVGTLLSFILEVSLRK